MPSMNPLRNLPDKTKRNLTKRWPEKVQSALGARALQVVGRVLPVPKADRPTGQMICKNAFFPRDILAF
jgi:hypothetical protein